MQADYAVQYQSLWQRHWWWRARERFVAKRLATLAAQRPLHNILDVGCGNGLFFDHLLQYGNVTGIEPDARLITDGPHRQRILNQPFNASYQPAQPLDLILMLDVLEHIDDDLAAATHVKNILAPGGYFLLTVPALMSLWSVHDVANDHYRRYSKKQLRAVLERAGLRVLTCHYYYFWAAAPLFARRLLAPAPKTAPAHYHVSVPPAPINGLFYTITRLEQAIFSAFPPPLGSSLFAIATKEG